ncbi:MAG: hypothetical protein LBT95_02165 [Treponema sp.]|jgi:hypothetical protein|nr:hypothetical protein [Treponema sp.]
MKDGDILVAQWGYEQTNVDFFQVIGLTGTMATIREIEKREEYDGNTMAGKARPVKDVFIGGAVRRKAKSGHNGQEYLKIEPYSFAYPWDGTPQRFSTYA